MTFIAPQAKLFRHLDRLQDLQYAGRTDAPINAEIDLSNRCSLGCSYCHFAYSHTRGPLAGKREKPANAIPGGDLMETSLALDIIRQLAEAGVQSITWTGGGEPTLHPAFNEIIEYARGLVSQGIYTHGGHIDNERAQLLKETMTFVYVSLDAIDRKSYFESKGVDRFNAACDGIRRLTVFDSGATVGVGFLVTETNYRDVGQAALLADALGADYVQYRPVIRYSQDRPGELAEDTGWLTAAMEEIARLDSPNVEADLARFRMYRDWTGHGYPTCWWVTLQTVITPNGMVWRCVNQREHASALLGDLSVEPFRDVWERATAHTVDGDCRVSCRGHMSNLALAEIMADRPHPEFV